MFKKTKVLKNINLKIKIMNIQHGDIITLDNGDTVEVSLKVLSKKVTELIPEHKYELKYTGNFCHCYSTMHGRVNSLEEYNPYVYVGALDLTMGRRGIFVSTMRGDVAYAMFSISNLDFVVKEIL
jgi:hypothetical protein